MDTRVIRCFQQVYEKKSIHQAAKVLFLTPQGVSLPERETISMNTAVLSPPSCSGSSWGSRK